MNVKKSIAMSVILLLLSSASQASLGDSDFDEGNKALHSFNDYSRSVGVANDVYLAGNTTVHPAPLAANTIVNDNRIYDSGVHLDDNVIGGNVEIGNNSHNTTINHINLKQSAKQSR